MGILFSRLSAAIDRFRYRQLLDFTRSREAAFYRAITMQTTADARWRSRGSKTGLPIGNYFEFGVWNGDSLLIYRKVLRHLGLSTNPQWKMFGFDSFEGLPVPAVEEDRHRFSAEGSFKSRGVAYVESRMRESGIPSDRVQLHPGFFEESLTNELKEQLGRPPVGFVNLDVDYFSSTIIALDWVEDLLFDGSIVFMDDVFFYNGHPGKGQLKAVSQFNTTRDSAGLYQAFGLDPWGRVFVYWKDTPIQAEEGLKF